MFEDRTAAAGLAAPVSPSPASAPPGSTMTTTASDLLVVNGAVRLIDEQARRGDPFPYAETHQMFKKLGGGRFTDVSGTMGEPFHRAEVGARRRLRGRRQRRRHGRADRHCERSGALLINEQGAGALAGLRLVGRPPGAKGERDMLGSWVAVARKEAPIAIRRRGAARRRPIFATVLWLRSACAGAGSGRRKRLPSRNQQAQDSSSFRQLRHVGRHRRASSLLKQPPPVNALLILEA